MSRGRLGCGPRASWYPLRMAKPARELESEALKLSRRQRARLAQRLISSLDQEVDADAERLWLPEAERRLAELRSGKVAAIPAERVLKKVRAALRWDGLSFIPRHRTSSLLPLGSTKISAKGWDSTSRSPFSGRTNAWWNLQPLEHRLDTGSGVFWFRSSLTAFCSESRLSASTSSRSCISTVARATGGHGSETGGRTTGWSGPATPAAQPDRWAFLWSVTF